MWQPCTISLFNELEQLEEEFRYLNRKRNVKELSESRMKVRKWISIELRIEHEDRILHSFRRL